MTALADRMGGPPLLVTIGGTAVPADAVGPVTIRRGRSGADDRPDAAQLTLTLVTERLTAAPELGAAVAVDLSAAAVAYFGAAPGAVPRFRGRVTDLTAHPATRSGPAVLDVVAVGPRVRLAGCRIPLYGTTPAGSGGVILGAAPIALDAGDPELDGARARRVLDVAATILPGLVVGTVDAGTAKVLPLTDSPLNALAALEQLAADVGGELVELRDGSLAYRTTASRVGTTPAVTLTGANVVAPSSWTQTLDGLVGRLVLVYGYSDARVTASDPAALARYDPPDVELSTQLWTQDDANARAADLVGRRSRPLWRVDDLDVELVETVATAQAAALLGVDYGALVALVELPTSGPRTSALVYVEGATERVTGSGWSLALAVTDRRLTAAPTRWLDLGLTVGARRWDWSTQTWRDTGQADGPVTWAALDPAVTWSTAVVIDA